MLLWFVMYSLTSVKQEVVPCWLGGDGDARNPLEVEGLREEQLDALRE